ncbi:MAG: bifunctional diaminohydroxyphosphoribosylaminopyrimidine deaminase/5-amino-6-(5-phosphoribosylamino)uracil reductase RibD [Thermoanaerobaculia bacterium]
MPNDEELMRRALRLAEKGRYSVSPNPIVGAVVAKHGRIVAEGFHARAGDPHAEIEALRRAGERARGATLVVTLEPCSHRGRTGPCAAAVAEAGIVRVVAARRDPNPAVAGRGFRLLRRAGVGVETGLLRAESALQNERFDHWVTSGRPFVLAKVASTLDGRIADANGTSRWVSGGDSRQRSLEWREEFDAILVGARTAVLDRSRLTRRLGWNRTTRQRRIVLDGGFSVPESAEIFRNPEGVEVWVSSSNAAKERRLRSRGVEVVRIPARNGGVDLRKALARLGRESVTGLIVEGGTRTLTGFHDAGLVDRWAIFYSPRLLGGRDCSPILAGRDVGLSHAPWLHGVRVEEIGEDILVSGRT